MLVGLLSKLPLILFVTGSCAVQDAEMCWICLDMSGELIRPCRCPRCVDNLIMLY